MSEFASIDTREYQNSIKEKLSVMIDPISRELPLNPVYANYQDSDLQPVRLYSKETIQELQRQNEISRQILEELKQDKTGIFVALKYTENLSESDTRYKEFLLKMENLTSEKILAILRELNQMVKIVNFSLTAQPFLLKIHRILHKDIEVYLQAFSDLVLLESVATNKIDALKTIKGLFNFYEAMFKEQTAITAIRHGQLVIKGVPLTPDQVICPATRKKLIVSRSLETSNNANDFLAICIALSQLAKLREDDIEDFLKRAPLDYLENANNKLLQYLRYPFWFNFSPAQKQFLREMGIESAANQLRYSHLWNEEKSLKENVLSLLIDYTKQDWRYPVFGLFITGHWNRHHHAEIRETITLLKSGSGISATLQKLEQQAKARPDYNTQGSLACRLEFIQRKMVKAAAIDPVDNPALSVVF